MTNVELYEALKGSIPEDAARMIAEAFHPAQELATRSDLVGVQASLRQEIAELRTDVREGFAAVRAELASVRGEIKAASEAQTRRMLSYFVPLWIATWGGVVAIALKG